MPQRPILNPLRGVAAAGRRIAVVVVTLLVSTAVASSIPATAAIPAPAAAPTWRLTGEMSVGHAPAHGSPFAVLRDGRILAATAAAADGLTAVAELYDPATETWTPTDSVNTPRWGFSNLIVLDNGTALIAGGHDAQANDLATTELYDPATGQWSLGGQLNTSRRHSVVIKLSNGKVLDATGAHGPPDGSRFLNSAEIYDPATGAWTPTASAPTRRESADGILMTGGRVMIVGGYSCCDTQNPETDLYDPNTATWISAGNRPHGGGGMALVNLPDGRVLSVGGSGTQGALAEALIFDPTTNQWSATTTPQFARSGADATVLDDGTVLVAGGGPAESELFNPQTSTWTVGPSLSTPRSNGQMLELGTGDILMVGGYRNSDNQSTTVTELYGSPTPADLFGFPMDTIKRTGLIGYDVHIQRNDFAACYRGKRFSDLWHAGEDWFAPIGTSLQAVADGTVAYVNRSAHYPGAVVIIQHALPGGGSIWSMYGHLDPTKVTLNAGAVVRKGDPIANGLVRQTYNGRDNTHLHWEMRYFYDGTGIKRAPQYRVSCSGVPGPGYTYPGHPDNFVANNGAGPTYRWTAPTAFVDTH